MKAALIVVLALLLGGCASHRYEEAQSNYQQKTIAFQKLANPIFNDILEKRVLPSVAFAKLASIARSIRPDDQEFQDIWNNASSESKMGESGELTPTVVANHLTANIEAWQARQKAILRLAANKDAEDEASWNSVATYLAVGAASVGNSATSYTPTYTQNQLFNEPPNLIYVDPYVRSNGTFVNGHFRTAPNFTCLDNLSGC